MKINRKLLSIAVLGAILGLASCNNDDGPSKLSKQDAKTQLDQFNTSAVTDLQSLSDADGMTAVKDLFDLTNTDDPFSRIGGTDKKTIVKFFREKGQQFKTIFVPKAIGGRTADEAFDYASKTGVYAWDPDNSVFVRTGDSDIIRIQFPTKDSQSNNAELQITAYTQKEFIDQDTQETYYDPQTLKAAIYVGEVKVASIDLNITWGDDEFPTALDLSVFVSPFTATISFSGTSTTSNLSTSLKKNDDIILATDVTVKYDNESKTSDAISTVSGYVQLKNLKLQGSLDVKAADASQDGDPNKYVHLALYADNKKVGDVVFQNDGTSGSVDYVPYIKYSDGTTEKLEDVLKPVIDEINSLGDDFSNS